MPGYDNVMSRICNQLGIFDKKSMIKYAQYIENFTKPVVLPELNLPRTKRLVKINTDDGSNLYIDLRSLEKKADFSNFLANISQHIHWPGLILGTLGGLAGGWMLNLNPVVGAIIGALLGGFGGSMLQGLFQNVTGGSTAASPQGSPRLPGSPNNPQSPHERINPEMAALLQQTIFDTFRSAMSMPQFQDIIRWAQQNPNHPEAQRFLAAIQALQQRGFQFSPGRMPGIASEPFYPGMTTYSVYWGPYGPPPGVLAFPPLPMPFTR